MIINKFNDEANDSVKKTTDELGTADEIKDEEFYDFEEAVEPVFVPMALDYLIDYNDAFRNEQPTRFRDEVINQTLSSKILYFNSISMHCYTEILADKYKRKIQAIKENCPQYAFLPDSIDDKSLNELVMQSYERQFGARPADKTINRHIESLILKSR